ncbi:MAG: tRNA/rRNA methyltransferase (SpoU) [Firmicutes bacterium]|nr:tRNA/rRNA methyltransferase (SpoU) [Bacillota bacterium]
MMEEINSITNPFIKMAASLKQKKYRMALELFAIEGVRFAEEVITSDWEAQHCLYTREAAKGDRVKRILSDLAKRKCRLIQVNDSVYERISDTEHPQGIMVIVKRKNYCLADLTISDQTPFLVLLDCVQDPGNVGAIIRTADAAGCTGVILTNGCADLFSGKTLRSSMGSIFHLPIVTGAETASIQVFFANHGISIAAACLETPLLHWEAALTGPLAIVFGNEGSGVSHEWLVSAKSKLRIPIYGKAESLNVASAAAVFLYEAARQRRACL